jgi:hypothetical protein
VCDGLNREERAPAAGTLVSVLAEARFRITYDLRQIMRPFLDHHLFAFFCDEHGHTLQPEVASNGPPVCPAVARHMLIYRDPIAWPRLPRIDRSPDR